MSRIFKTAIAVISLTMFVNFLFTAAMGVYRSFHAFYVLYNGGPEAKPGIEILESLDLFLVGLVFLILSFGFMKLFYPEFSWFHKINLPWLKVEDFIQLKQLTWNAMLLTLLIIFGAQVIRSNRQLDWTLLIIPVSVALFSISAKFLKH
jgi:uncharacterized membrane protein YqhA